MSDTSTRTGIFGRLAAPVCLSASLAACDTIGGMTNSDVPPPCPPVSSLADAARITRFVDGPGRDIIDIDFTGRIEKLTGKCFYELDSDTGEGQVRINIKPEFRIERGAANKTRQAAFDYFISYTDDQGNVLDKQIFPYTAKYWKNKQVVKDIDGPIEVTIQLRNGQIGQDFNIYVGFQLSQEELDFNRGNTSR